ncbi:MAG: holo-ACP synthase [Candidatus Marinimicrobia bacterium]|nr:holo-ACP synthase [Candidatus Neomarinimicrobiota bacterium]MBT3495859.1 holo-ACP synthase [Candidatus Neomarinimicrobiota bacterium]MBT3692849.1 holo-ACP synthase [Candidatus Neomarinimicrobiota bacterium]MBT4144312.1 holo-ACP synthase [Candidatus Neomarinimicrobiota bacterium]MBT4177043.1 holo-ACP synthase [Candidatus Neomarinimicrobiota bacterium]
MSDIFIGTDIVSVQRIRDILGRHSERFKNKTFTSTEIKYCQSKANPAIHFSGRFSAKEAIQKAIYSSGYKTIIPLKKIEIISGNDGEPLVHLLFFIQGKCKVSISHTEDTAIAFALFNLET